MNLKTAVFAAMIPLLIVTAPGARADLAGSLQREKELQAQINQLQAKVNAQRSRAYMLGRNGALADKDLNAVMANKVLNDFEKELGGAQKKLQHIQGKIATQRADAAKDAAKDAARAMAANAARDAAYAAAKAAAKEGAKEGAKTASKSSSKDSGQSAAQSAAHPPPPPVCKPSH